MAPLTYSSISSTGTSAGPASWWPTSACSARARHSPLSIRWSPCTSSTTVSRSGIRTGPWVEQRVKVLSNVALSIPYDDFVSLQQVVYCAEKNGQYDRGARHAHRYTGAGRRVQRPDEQPELQEQHRPAVPQYPADLPPLLTSPCTIPPSASAMWMRCSVR